MPIFSYLLTSNNLLKIVLDTESMARRKLERKMTNQALALEMNHQKKKRETAGNSETYVDTNRNIAVCMDSEELKDLQYLADKEVNFKD